MPPTRYISSSSPSSREHAAAPTNGHLSARDSSGNADFGLADGVTALCFLHCFGECDAIAVRILDHQYLRGLANHRSARLESDSLETRHLLSEAAYGEGNRSQASAFFVLVHLQPRSSLKLPLRDFRHWRGIRRPIK